MHLDFKAIVLVFFIGCVATACTLDDTENQAPSPAVEEVRPNGSTPPTAPPAVDTAKDSEIVPSPSVNLPPPTLTSDRMEIEPTLILETPTAPATSENDGNTLCTGPPELYTIRRDGGPYAILNLRFQTERHLAFSGWFGWDAAPVMNVQNAENRPTDTVGKLSSYATVLEGRFDLDTLDVTYSSDVLLMPLRNPCPDECARAVLSASPDGRWQLISSWHNTNEFSGLWVINETSIVKLVDYVPSITTWQWSRNSQLLLVEHSQPEFGGSGYIVELNTEPTAMPITMLDGLAPTYNYVALDEETGEIFALSARNSDQSRAEPFLRRYDLEDGALRLLSEDLVPQLRKVEWNGQLASMVFTYSNGTMTWFQIGTDGPVLELPFSAFGDLVPVSIVRDNVPFAHLAVAPDGNRIITSLGDGRIYLFHCQEP